MLWFSLTTKLTITLTLTDTVKLISHSPCHSPCVASPVRKPTREAQGSADQSMKKPILVSVILLNEPLKALMLVASTARWSSWFHLLITRLEKKYLQQSRVHLNLTSFLECPLVPMLLSAKVKNSFSLSHDIPLHILNTSMRSCLFRLSSSVHNFKHCNLSSRKVVAEII